jgi:hypothetical protein
VQGLVDEGFENSVNSLIFGLVNRCLMVVVVVEVGGVAASLS